MLTARFRGLGLLLLLLCIAGALVLPASAGVRFGGVGVGFGYDHFSGAGYPPYYSAPFWGPFGGWGYDPFWGPYAPIYYFPQADKGEIKLETTFKDADVYLDNGYAGTVSKLKTFWLAPGVYQLEVRPKDQQPRSKRIYVLTGKTLKIRFE